MGTEHEEMVFDGVLVFGGAGLGLVVSYILLSDAIRFAHAGPTAVVRICLWAALQLLAITVLVLAWKLGPDARSGLTRLAISPFIAGMLLDMFVLRPRVEQWLDEAEGHLGQSDLDGTTGGDS